jgi:hypothetical protein
MLARCAWCGLALGERAPREDGGTTYGVCPACWMRLMAEAPEGESGADPAPAEPRGPARATNPTSVPP